MNQPSPLFPYADVPGFETLQIVQDVNRTSELGQIVAGMDKSELENLYVSAPKVGTALLFKTGDVVLEVMLSKFDGTLHTLYRTHPMFEDRQLWLQTRLILTEIINDIADTKHDGSMRATQAINEFGAALLCPVRGKSVRVHSLGTAQMLDVIRANRAVESLTTQLTNSLANSLAH